MSHSKKTIIVVDDEPDIRLALTLLLEDAGYNVEALESGDGLIERLHSGVVVDLILLDMLLAGRDGRELVAALKADPITRHIVVLMLSAHPNAAREAAAAGADGFVAKPFELEALLTKVASCLA